MNLIPWRVRNREKYLAGKRAWTNKNRDKIRQRERETYHLRAEKARQRAREWYHANKDRKREYDKLYSARPEVREREREAWKRYYKLRPESYSKWSRTHPEELREIKRRWEQKNKDKCRAKVIKRRALKIGATVGNVKEIEAKIKHLRTSQDTTCEYCGISISGTNVHIEHKIPLSRGGAHSLDNLAPSCGPCNYMKSNKTPEEFMAYKLKKGL